jgi:hypothetical protein
MQDRAKPFGADKQGFGGRLCISSAAQDPPDENDVSLWRVFGENEIRIHISPSESSVFAPAPPGFYGVMTIPRG